MVSREKKPQRQQETVAEDLILLGEFGRAQGLRGDIRLKSYAEDPVAIGSYNLLTKDGKTVSLTDLRVAPGREKDLFLVRVEGVTTREQAELLNRTQLFITRDQLPETEEDEFLLTDLIGLNVQDTEGTPVGTVRGVPNYGGGDLLEIRKKDSAETFLVPFTKIFVPIIDISGQFVVIDYTESTDKDDLEKEHP